MNMKNKSGLRLEKGVSVRKTDWKKRVSELDKELFCVWVSHLKLKQVETIKKNSMIVYLHIA